MDAPSKKLFVTPTGKRYRAYSAIHLLDEEIEDRRIEDTDSNGSSEVKVALTEKKLFSIRDLIYIGSIVSAALGVIWKVGVANEGVIKDVKALQEIWAEHSKESKERFHECENRIRNLEITEDKAHGRVGLDR